jgi:predicted DNA-binding transcriptional regulator AlpA
VRLLSHEQVNELTGKRSRIQRWRDAKADRFPPPVRDGDRKRWPDTEIESYLRWRIAVRDSCQSFFTAKGPGSPLSGISEWTVPARNDLYCHSALMESVCGARALSLDRSPSLALSRHLLL